MDENFSKFDDLRKEIQEFMCVCGLYVKKKIISLKICAEAEAKSHIHTCISVIIIIHRFNNVKKRWKGHLMIFRVNTI